MTFLRCFARAPRQCVQQCRFKSDAKIFQENDSVILRRKDEPSNKPIFLSSLKPGKTFHTHRGVVRHDDIIGKAPRDVIEVKLRDEDRKASKYRVHEARLDEYVTAKGRLVTPLYPQDAQLIVNLFDLHPDPQLCHEGTLEGTLEILEAGTGHGALTLYLSRAIHAANPPRPQLNFSTDSCSAGTQTGKAIATWKKSRRAIIHSVEVSERYSKHAESVVKSFRHGMYHGNVDFYVDSVGPWVQSTLEGRNGKPFLSHAFLDIPGAHDHIDTLSGALKTDGVLLVFTPSISQIIDVIRTIKAKKLPLGVDRVIELGVNGGSGGRDWDVRPVVPRAEQTLPSITSSPPDTSAANGCLGGYSVTNTASSDRDAGVDFKWVCRPKVGEYVVGGGFLVLLRRFKTDQ